MTNAITNQDKYNNYREQFHRLKKAIDMRFYLEAIFIEYAIMEDRMDSIISYEGNNVKSKRKNGFVTFSDKKRKVMDLSREKKSIIARYFSDDLLDNIMEWVDGRNSKIHALLKQNLTTDELQRFAEKGEELCKELRNRANNYKRMVIKRGSNV